MIDVNLILKTLKDKLLEEFKNRLIFLDFKEAEQEKKQMKTAILTLL